MDAVVSVVDLFVVIVFVVVVVVVFVVVVAVVEQYLSYPAWIVFCTVRDTLFK